MTSIPIFLYLFDTDCLIVTYLDSIQARLASHKGMILQSATGEELSALMPSILDKAFKGEL